MKTNRHLRTLVAVLLVSVASSPNAGTASYQCKVLSASAVDRDGALTSDTKHLKSQIGSGFAVDRENGKILGGPGDNTSYKEKSVTYTPKNAFHVVSKSHGPNLFITYLQVHEWVEDPKKPFVLVNSGHVYSGLCE